MAKLWFNMQPTLAKIIEHTMAHPPGNVPYTEERAPKPFLVFVKDRGAYILSGAKEQLSADDNIKGHLVCYADGCNPDNDVDCWETSRNICGGDDFAEPIPINLFKQALDTGAPRFFIDLGPSEMTLGFTETIIPPHKPLPELGTHARAEDIPDIAEEFDV